jgi:hypothetical protein
VVVKVAGGKGKPAGITRKKAVGGKAKPFKFTAAKGGSNKSIVRAPLACARATELCSASGLQSLTREARAGPCR